MENFLKFLSNRGCRSSMHLYFKLTALFLSSMTENINLNPVLMLDVRCYLQAAMLSDKYTVAIMQIVQMCEKLLKK